MRFSAISKQYGRQVLFVDASFQLSPGEKVGLVGPNGAGKTTLFRLITGEEQPDEGGVSVPRKLSIGYFRQDVEEMSGRSVLDEAIAGSGRRTKDSSIPSVSRWGGAGPRWKPSVFTCRAARRAIPRRC